MSCSMCSLLAPLPSFTSLVLVNVNWRHCIFPTAQGYYPRVRDVCQSRAQTADLLYQSIHTVTSPAAHKLDMHRLQGSDQYLTNTIIHCLEVLQIYSTLMIILHTGSIICNNEWKFSYKFLFRIFKYRTCFYAWSNGSYHVVHLL